MPSQRRTLRRTAGPGASCPQLLQAGDRVVVRRTLRRIRWRRNSLGVCLALIVRRLPDSRRLLLAGQLLVGLATADASRDGGGRPGHHCGSADCSYHSTSSSTWHQATLDEIDERRGCLTREWLIEFDQEPVDRAQLADVFGHRRLHRSDSGGARTGRTGKSCRRPMERLSGSGSRGITASGRHPVRLEGLIHQSCPDRHQPQSGFG